MLLSASPALAASIGDDAPLLAFQASNGHLWTTCTVTVGVCVQGQKVSGSDPTDTGLAMAPNTSPAIVYDRNVGGQDEIAFQGSDGNLWTTGFLGTQDTGIEMQPGTSPSISPDGATNGEIFVIAFQSQNANLITVQLNSADAVEATHWYLPVDSKTTPSVALVGGGYEVAYRSGTNGALALAGTLTTGVTGYGLAAGTSPSISGFGTSGYEVAFNANGTNHLWTYGTLGTADRGLGMAPGTSPSIAPITATTYEVAFQANTGVLWTYGNAGIPSGDTGHAMKAGTSPAISGNVLLNGATPYDDIVAYQANTGVLGVYSEYEGSFLTDLGMDNSTSPASGTAFN